MGRKVSSVAVSDACPAERDEVPYDAVRPAMGSDAGRHGAAGRATPIG